MTSSLDFCLVVESSLCEELSTLILEQGFAGAAGDLEGVTLGTDLGSDEGTDLGVGEILGDFVVAESRSRRCVVSIFHMDDEILGVSEFVAVGDLYSDVVLAGSFVVEALVGLERSA